MKITVILEVSEHLTIKSSRDHVGSPQVLMQAARACANEVEDHAYQLKVFP